MRGAPPPGPKAFALYALLADLLDDILGTSKHAHLLPLRSLAPSQALWAINPPEAAKPPKALKALWSGFPEGKPDHNWL